MQLPGSLRYLQPDTNWGSTPWSSFDSIVDQVIAHRMQNPHLIQTNGWSVDRKTVEAEVEAYNVKICEAMHWDHFLEGGPEVSPTERPFPPGQTPHLLHSLKNVAAGGEILVEWIKDGAEAVPIAQATKRASICADCPKNVKADLTSIFTVPVSWAIKKELERRKELRLETSFDDRLGVCSACSCPMKLKIWIPLNSFLHKMTSEAMNELDPKCWILQERDGK